MLVQLVEVRTKRVLYDKRFVCNTSSDKAVRVPYDPQAVWADVQALRNDVPGVRTAIVATLEKMADLIAADISSKGRAADAQASP